MFLILLVELRKRFEVNFTEVNFIEPVSKTKRTIKHGARFSRKLQRRLTRRTLVEARALKEQGTECIHVLLYVIELVRSGNRLIDYSSIVNYSLNYN